MANNITGNPWYIDTAGTIFKTRFKFDGGLWSPKAPSVALIMTDITGRTVVNLEADTVGANVDLGKLGWINGLVVTSIAGDVSLFVAYR